MSKTNQHDLVKVYRQATSAVQSLNNPARRGTLFQGDCTKLLDAMPSNSVDLVVTSPPYCIGKEYEKGWDLDRFKQLHQTILPAATRVLKDGGSLCWEVGYHVKDGVTTPLDFLIFEIASKIPGLKLRNRIVWSYEHGLHGVRRFSGRHETILWFTKGDNYYFDLDPVRVRQKYPGKTHYKGPKAGQPSGNPLGKNPSDVWAHIPNVKAKHVEKTSHPCQFPIALAEQLVLSLSPEEGLVLDPFSGVASTGAAALRNTRKFIGAELSSDYCTIAEERLVGALDGTLKVRELETPIAQPDPRSKVATAPSHFAAARAEPSPEGAPAFHQGIPATSLNDVSAQVTSSQAQ
ncbi:site-specific DNA-methyltransferase [Herbaspirillum sp. C7C8]|uniref:DNA-methyltransferase n=1 Tax=Herbaspirillum sp. C7C8 TaxID=2736665 RepID=UPI001F51A4E8|nr:site-specific DNA-methyltransferase [Herbaspirillum sp. C7C8]MCI1006839.1 site-specific DNA-methyltransferase [Herbaspirillum sp. C7C8]